MRILPGVLTTALTLLLLTACNGGDDSDDPGISVEQTQQEESNDPTETPTERPDDDRDDTPTTPSLTAEYQQLVDDLLAGGDRARAALSTLQPIADRGPDGTGSALSPTVDFADAVPALVPALAQVMAAETDPAFRLIAVQLLGFIAEYFGDGAPPQAAESLVLALADSDSQVIYTAALYLLILGDQRGMDTLLALAQDPDMREQVARALRSYEHSEVFNDQIDAYFLDAMEARDLPVTRIGSPVLATLLGFEGPEADRIRAFFAVRLDSSDIELVRAAYHVVIRLARDGDAQAESLLIQALDTGPTDDSAVPMAEAMLNSGDPELSQTAQDWASRNGYTITRS